MAEKEKLVEDWQAMKDTLEEHLKAIEAQPHHDHGLLARETIQRWIVELDDLIIKYSFEI